MLESRRPHVGEVELVDRDVPTGSFEGLDDIVDARRVTVGPGRAVAVVRVRDRLECLQMLKGPVGIDADQELFDRVVVSFLASLR
ncbi:MAG: hypothetical protein JWR57_1320 [Mycetocola sp.]|jgi:hypothetical protein|nr:hypothetical protein [Mycetocola sp.]